jgi:hypothetical protein
VSPARSVVFIASIAAAFALGLVFHKSGVRSMPKTQYLKLSEPLLLNAGGELKYFHMLPAGTPMYKDESFPEGHTRYIVYINIKGAFQAEAIESDKPSLIDPIWAYTVKKDEVQQLMADTPISKDDLVRILKARKMTREELAQIVREWRE